ncbi:tRNA dihydrouridine(20/20a) synthase DusA [Methylophaga sulfidovorans]|uniref:tRNA-dihydrouridine(20/20a) synthase n=1 Tax=Methylophaga sulfidovorans TaxID=45496 RepID=A0A1I4B1L8_9GAMM|nr:tRNA dihydrouridine(20/20a) synthase DusA [Methylophaga sulfidovorans]SFK61809.1 tRNA-U16,U17-dihydrouridine synthase [Methylophaga sulfidovorans]
MTSVDLSHAHRLSVAPMLDWTDRDFRYLLRLISKHTLLYTEMVTTGALIHGDRQRFLAHNAAEYPLALQLGGSDPTALAECAKMGEDAGYSEINLNVGCPSDRVQSGSFGACLMAEPGLVAEGVAAMQKAVNIPVTVKTRLGIDEQDSYEFLTNFIDAVSAAGCNIFILHARKAWLKGLSPKENRDVPPLDYQRVYQIKKDYPHLHIDINGGIHSLLEVQQHLQYVDGTMLGRAIYNDPYLLIEADERIFMQPAADQPSRHDVIEAMLPYIAERMQQGRPLKSITRHLLGLFQGQPGARRWRRHLSENAHLAGAGIHTLQQALSLVEKT